ncbi:MAG: TonB-dependent receptor [Bacteroidota bacterium]
MAFRLVLEPDGGPTVRMAAVVMLAIAVGLPSVCGIAAGTTGKISGHVTDAKTREPMVGVNVVLVGTSRGASTDLQGEYFIANVPPGAYSLKATQVGFRDAVVNDVRVHVDATTEINFAMVETVLDVGQEVVVTAQRPVVEKDNTATRVFLESAEIISRPATSVTEVVSTLPSINIDNGVMSVRGGLLNEVAFIVDGARARNPLNQEAFTNVNLSSIQEMEVITGSYNAEYGEARSGVFNVITKEGGDNYWIYGDFRYTPPGVKHWGPSLYDPNTPVYWENTHARHLQWWIDHPDQWVDPTGLKGSDPRTIWTPEQGYQNYLQTHQPLTDYDRVPGYQAEISLGGPVPFVSNATVFLSGKYTVKPPLMGNAFAKRGRYFDGNAKITYRLSPGMKLQLSGFIGNSNDSWGYESVPNVYWAMDYGMSGRYAYYDLEGLPRSETDGQTLKLTDVVSDATMYEVKLSRVFAARSTDILPGDPIGWDANEATTDNLRAEEPVKDASGRVIGVFFPPGGYRNIVGYHTLGYFHRYDDKNTDWTLTGFYQSQVNKRWQLKTGLELTYYHLNHFNQAKSPDRFDKNIYTPYQGAIYEQNKLEFSGFIMNAGLRFDFYNPNDYVYQDVFNPMEGAKERTKPFTQLSPRLGISHPIDENTVLHFSYGHFFERGSFGDYGEGTEDNQSLGSLTTFLVDKSTPLIPWVLGNRAVKPEQTVAYELAIERNFFDELLLTVTGYYKDIRNTIRVVTVVSPYGIYRTNGNADYADVRGLEISLRKQPSRYSWGMLWGYANFTTQLGVRGSSGAPSRIEPDRILYPTTTGDYIQYSPSRLKAGLYYESPAATEFLASVLDRVSVTMEYQGSFYTKENLGDAVIYNGVAYPRPADHNVNLKVRKDFEFGAGGLRLGVYAEVRNLLNFKSLNLDFLGTATDADVEKLVSSGFKDVPTVDQNGVPYLELAQYRNLPRSVVFGVTMEM